MEKIYVIGDAHTVAAFRLAGVQGVVSGPDRVAGDLNAVAGAGDAGIVLVTRELSGHAGGLVARMSLEMTRPLVLDIPGVNDRPEHFKGIAALARDLPGLKGVEIMPYHQLGENKVGRFGLDQSRRAKASAPEPGVVEGWTGELRRRGVNVLTA
mgnify:CR=1 FL=1